MHLQVDPIVDIFILLYSDFFFHRDKFMTGNT